MMCAFLSKPLCKNFPKLLQLRDNYILAVSLFRIEVEVVLMVVLGDVKRCVGFQCCDDRFSVDVFLG